MDLALQMRSLGGTCRRAHVVRAIGAGHEYDWFLIEAFVDECETKSVAVTEAPGQEL
jgi:hypothetical protein